MYLFFSSEKSYTTAVTAQRCSMLACSACNIGSTVKPVLSDHVWALKKWSLNTGGLLIKGACTVWLSFGTSGSGRSRLVVTEYKWSQDRFHCSVSY